MIDMNELTAFYRQELETSIIGYLAKRLGTNYREAMDIYFNSRLSKLIETGANGIDNLDYKNLTEDLIENELSSFTSVVHSPSK